MTFTDAGVYSCHATNKFGSANANGTLIVKGRISFLIFFLQFQRACLFDIVAKSYTVIISLFPFFYYRCYCRGFLERTVIKDGPEDYEVAAGQTATFRCNAVADSSLNLTIDWLHVDQLIDFEQEPRFVQSQDQSLTITKTTELDTGDYTCRARTILDSAEAKATLIVQGTVQSQSRDSIILLLLFIRSCVHAQNVFKHLFLSD